MTDQLFLSVWLDQNGRRNRIRQFERVLRAFPFSQRLEQPQSTISVLAVDSTEPPLLERPVNGPVEVDQILGVFAEYEGKDVAYELESWWDLWTLEEEWKLRPTRVVISCFSEDFDNGTSEDRADQEDLRIDLGVDTNFLPVDDVPGSTRMVESNVKSVLRLVHELDRILAMARRQLQTESGDNFALRLQEALTARVN